MNNRCELEEKIQKRITVTLHDYDEHNTRSPHQSSSTLLHYILLSVYAKTNLIIFPKPHAFAFPSL